MSDRFNSGQMQGILSQVIKEIQNGLTKLEQSVNQASQAGGNIPDGETFTPTQEPPQPQQAQAAPPTPATPYTGSRWEYKVVYVNFRGQISSEGQQLMIGRGERRSSFVRNYLDQIGQQGWELSGVSPLGETENSYFIFKRPSTGERVANTASTSTAAPRSEGQRIKIEEVDDGDSSFIANA
ncbi:MAG: hypothetical protein WCS37_12255 [Chloroflexota bacterium]|nr:DUF4177 domain-containing protein [Chloroflexota bacterium]